MDVRFALYSFVFWRSACLVGVVASAFFLWQLDAFDGIGITGPPRPAPGTFEIVCTVLIILLLMGNAGFFAWRRRNGTCPIGIRRGVSAATALGVLALLCPICSLGAFAFYGFAIGLGFLSAFIPLLHVIAIVLLLTTLWLLTSER